MVLRSITVAIKSHRLTITTIIKIEQLYVTLKIKVIKAGSRIRKSTKEDIQRRGLHRHWRCCTDLSSLICFSQKTEEVCYREMHELKNALKYRKDLIGTMMGQLD